MEQSSRSRPGGVPTVLHSFHCTDGCNPVAGLIQGAGGNFYGTTFAANGTVFKIQFNGVFTTIHSFNFVDGSGPNAMLVQGTDGNFYGTADSGGINGNGTVFRITSGGTFKQLHSFTCGRDGCVPVAGLVQGADGSLYGTSREGGANGDGTVFKITATGTLTSLHTFAGADGAAPFGGLMLATDGNFYGTTSAGGTLNNGTISRISPKVVTQSFITLTAPPVQRPMSHQSSIRTESYTVTLSSAPGVSIRERERQRMKGGPPVPWLFERTKVYSAVWSRHGYRTSP